jgi:hypothetical protein
MATKQTVTHFDLKPDFDVLVRPAHGGERIVDPDGWEHYAWHVLVMCRDENFSYVYRTGTGLITMTDDYRPIIPDARQIVQTIAADVESVRDYPTLPDFIETFEYSDIRRAITIYEAGRRFLADFQRVFPLHIQHFIDTYRED